MKTKEQLIHINKLSVEHCGVKQWNTFDMIATASKYLKSLEDAG